MDQKAIVRRLLDSGIMATPDDIKGIQKNGLDYFLKKATADVATTPTEKPAKGLVCRSANAKCASELTAADVIRCNSEKFEKISRMLLRKADAVSINNMGGSGKICILGMVREKTPDGFILEDGTGYVEVRAKESVDLDDVIGVRGWLRDSALFGEEILYPDVPISRQIVGIDGRVLLSCGSSAEKGDADTVINPCSSGESSDRPKVVWFELESSGKKMTVVFYRPDSPADMKTAMSWLRKRYLGSVDGVANESERIMEAVPDILWIFSEGEPWTGNYKGVAMVSFGEGHCAAVDLTTRKIEIASEKAVPQSKEI